MGATKYHAEFPGVWGDTIRRVYTSKAVAVREAKKHLANFRDSRNIFLIIKDMSNILQRADMIVNHRSEEKERQYGPFSESMKRAAEMFNLMSPPPQKITPEGMFRALICLKLTREAYGHKEDNLLDAVAYIGGLNNLIEEDKL